MKYTLLFLLLSTFCFSQKVSFIYDVRYKVRSQESEKPISETMVLDIENSNSIFRQSIDKKTDSLAQINENVLFNMGVENQFYVKKNGSDNYVIKLITYLQNNYTLPISEILNWKILSDQKLIGKYKCQNAEVNYGGRKWTAWFSTELRFNDGPYIFHGLPGLIISIEDEKKDYVFNLIEVKKLGELFDVRSKTKNIDWEQYEKLAKSYYNDPMDLNSQLGKYFSLTDVKGEKMDLNQFIKTRQRDIKANDNPIELNHKIHY